MMTGRGVVRDPRGLVLGRTGIMTGDSMEVSMDKVTTGMALVNIQAVIGMAVKSTGTIDTAVHN